VTEAKPKSRSTVLVGIVTRNRAMILSRAIKSTYEQDYEPLCTAVIDDASSDDTIALATQFPSVAWTRWDVPRGYLAARNTLMAESHADYFISLDDDAWFVGDDAVSLAVEHLETHPRVAAAAFDILDPARAEPVRRTAPRPTKMFIGCGHILRLAAVRDVGLYAPTPGFYGGEEKDLCIRLRDKGWEIDLLPGVHVWHEKTLIARDEPAQHRSGVCNDLAFALRRCPLPMLLWVLPYKSYSHLRFSVRHRLVTPCLSGMGMFIRHAWSLWRTRGPVRAATFRAFVQRGSATS
jgi:GT2 family glycosyltransferase